MGALHFVKLSMGGHAPRKYLQFAQLNVVIIFKQDLKNAIMELQIKKIIAQMNAF